MDKRPGSYNVPASVMRAEFSGIGPRAPLTYEDRAWWAEAVPIAFTAADSYLHMQRLGYRPPNADLRFSDLGQVKEHPRMPRLLAGVRTPTGALTAIQETRLRQDGGLVLAARRILGDPGDGAVQLDHKSAVMGIAADVEDALAATQAAGVATWAAVSPSHLAAIRMPVGVRELHLFIDTSGVYDDAFYKMADVHDRRGVLIICRHPPEGYARWLDVVGPADPRVEPHLPPRGSVIVTRLSSRSRPRAPGTVRVTSGTGDGTS